ncbi:MAG: queuosine salvage family protein, partial [Vicinamibacterales bacterium]
IRRGCAAVAARARHVAITPRLSQCAAELAHTPLQPPPLDPVAHYLGRGDDTVAFFLTLDAINFGSGYFPLLRKRPGASGYTTIATALADRFRAHGPWSSEELSALSPADCAAVFGQDPAVPAIHELMTLFAAALNELGRFVSRHHEGRCAGVIDAAAGSAARLVTVLAGMPGFRDVARYDTLTVPFFKRAQLLAADLFLAFGGEGRGRFGDLHRLTIFADNLVPHVLHEEGVLAYADPLQRAIEAGELIEAGSEEEVEIRACAVHAAERLVAELAALGRPMPARQLDWLLWNRGQEPRYKNRPRHRTRTTFY